MDDLLLQTKLHPPPTPPTLVRRGPLLERLARVTSSRLTLVAAGAGFGKTTLVAAWLAAAQQGAQQGPEPSGQWQAAWLTLDEGDNDPQRFLHYWIAALQKAVPTCGEQARTLLLAPQSPPLTTLLTLLLNEMATLRLPLVLVLDDYHLITNPVLHDALTYIIDHLPPTVHLLITSRIDPPLPLARWRVRGYLSELRGADLRFSQAEIAAFFEQVAALPLSPAQNALVEARTEGWIAALQLLALSLQGQADVNTFLTHFSGGQRHVVDYLVDEVLNRQPAATQTFLLHTSILSRLSASLCAALLTSSPEEEAAASLTVTAAQAKLEELERRQLFLVPLDGERHWYRYHALFAEFLRHRLGEQATTRLHRRAARWYEANGYPEETITHTLAAHDHEHAVTLIEQHGLHFALRHQLTTVEGWLAALPATWRQNRPGLALISVWLTLGRGDTLAMARALQTVDTLMATQAPPDPTLQATTQAAHALVASFQQNHAATITHAQAALAGLPAAAELLRAAVISGLGYGYYCAGDLVQAEKTLRAALVIPPTNLEQLFIHCTLLAMLAMTVEMKGELAEATTLYRRALQLAHRPQEGEERYLPLPGIGVALHGLALRLYEANALDEAYHYAELARTLGEQSGNLMIYGHTLATLGLIAQARGDYTQAKRQMDEGYLRLEPLRVPSTAVIVAQRVMVWCKAGEVATALAWAKDFVQQMPPRPQPMNAFASPYFALARVWLIEARFAEADALLADLYASAEAGHYHYYCVWARILQCEAAAAQGQEATALAHLQAALRLAAPHGYCRSFLDEGTPLQRLLVRLATQIQHNQPGPDQLVSEHIHKLLAAYGPTAPKAQVASPPSPSLPPPPKAGTALGEPLIEPLSEREREVLQLLAHGHSNQAIADQLIVALSTVKKHLVHIYGKLAVTNRTQAINRARELQLL